MVTMVATVRTYPASTAPVNSIIAPIAIAWIKVRDLEDTEVAKAFATSLAPMFLASRKAKNSPITNMYVNWGRAAIVSNILRRKSSFSGM
jgi:hypothetical protein